MKMLAVALVAALGAYSLVGGIAGYVRAQSMASLIAGGIAGLVLLACAWFMSQDNKVWGWIAVVVIVALLGRFAPTFFKTKEWWPAGYMLVLAVPTAIVVLIHQLGGKSGT